MKIRHNLGLTLWILTYAMIFFCIFKYDDKKREEKNKELAKQNAKLEAETKRESVEANVINSKFAFVCDRITKRDLEIYKLAEKRDRELLEEVKKTIATTNKTALQSSLEEYLIQEISRHIDHCIETQKLIQETNKYLNDLGVYFPIEIYDTECKCNCCEDCKCF